MLKSQLGLLLIALCLAPRVEAQRQISHLKPGESLTLSYSEAGCFHSFDYRLRLLRKGQAIQLAVTELRHGVRKGKYHRQRINQGTHRLTTSDVRLLDEMLDYYRRPPGQQGCTTSAKLSLTWQPKTGSATTESFKDSSCSMPARLVGIPRLIKRILRKAPVKAP